jgi:hypothetical protein
LTPKHSEEIVDEHSDTTSYRAQNLATGQLALWTIAWTATLAAARFGPQLVWNPEQQPVASVVAVSINVLAGIGWVIAFARYLRALDDLWRKIMQDSLAVTLGAGWVVGFGYFVADAAGLVTVDLNLALFPVFLAVVYLIAILAGWIRFR